MSLEAREIFGSHCNKLERKKFLYLRIMKRSLQLQIILLSLILASMLIVSGCKSMPMKNEISMTSDFQLIEVMNTDGINPNRIFSFECELIVQKPEVATSACADFGEAVWDIEWNSWGATGAAGVGTYKVNDCKPNCAEGQIFEQKVKVRLDGLYTDGERYFLRNFSYEGVEPFPLDRSATGGWDVAEFYLEVPGMRTP